MLPGPLGVESSVCCYRGGLSGCLRSLLFGLHLLVVGLVAMGREETPDILNAYISQCYRCGSCCLVVLLALPRGHSRYSV